MHSVKKILYTCLILMTHVAYGSWFKKKEQDPERVVNRFFKDVEKIERIGASWDDKGLTLTAEKKPSMVRKLFGVPGDKYKAKVLYGERQCRSTRMHSSLEENRKQEEGLICCLVVAAACCLACCSDSSGDSDSD